MAIRTQVFHIGDKVQISSRSQYYKQNLCYGEIVGTEMIQDWKVVFQDGNSNSYNDIDLVPAGYEPLPTSSSTGSHLAGYTNSPLSTMYPSIFGNFPYSPSTFSTSKRVTKKRVVKKSKAEPQVTKISLDSVIISDDKKEQIRSAMSQVKNNEQIFTTWGFSEVFEKGTAISMLFWGIPGTGKTLTAQAVADELGAKLKVYGTAEIESSEPGGAERAIKAIFQEASVQHKKGNHQVLLFDECDSLLMDRNEVGPIISAQINTLLQEIEHYEGVIIFTTNRLGKLDAALERRISAKVEFVFPDAEQRALIWQRMIPKKAPIHKDVDFKKLAEYTLAGGNIKNAVLAAARMAAYINAKEITLAHFCSAIEKEVESVQAFIQAFESNPHSRQVDGVIRNSNSLSIDQKMVKQPVKTDDLSAMKGMFGSNAK